MIKKNNQPTNQQDSGLMFKSERKDDKMCSVVVVAFVCFLFIFFLHPDVASVYSAHKVFIDGLSTRSFNDLVTWDQ